MSVLYCEYSIFTMRSQKLTALQIIFHISLIFINKLENLVILYFQFQKSNTDDLTFWLSTFLITVTCNQLCSLWYFVTKLYL